MTTEVITIEQPELLEIANKSGLQKAVTHAATFSPFMQTVIEISSKLPGLKEDNPVDVKIARECRLALVKNRTATGKQKDADKATLLAEGNLIQSLHNVIVSKSQLIEADFEAIEKAAEIKEAARKAALKADRELQLSLYEIDLTGYNLAEMSDQTFSDLLTSQRLLSEERAAAAAKAEAEKLKRERLEAEERERIKIENEKLKAEAAKAKEAADKLAAENKAKLEAIEKSNRIAREKAAKEQAAKDKAAADALKAKQDEADKLVAELKAKQDAELKKEQDAKDKAAAEKLAADKLAKAPVKEKMKVWVNSVQLPNSPDMNTTADDIIAKFNGWKNWALTQIELL